MGDAFERIERHQVRMTIADVNDVTYKRSCDLTLIEQLTNLPRVPAVGRALFAERLEHLRRRQQTEEFPIGLKVRIIPCLGRGCGQGRQGTNFKDLRDAGDPVELAALYDREGADEIVFYDITASHENARPPRAGARAAEEVFVPYTIGGGVRSVDDMRAMLRAGADKVSVNSAAVA
jgi:hypothetical protein